MEVRFNMGSCAGCQTSLQFVWVLAVWTQSLVAGRGCSGDHAAGLFNNGEMAACQGVWTGHVRNASHLCAPGWRVCQWYDTQKLETVTWAQAVGIDGCYAYNAAQDGGRCRECRDDLEQDDLAGIGHGCPHQFPWAQTSCIREGRIDASCCVDAHFHKACHQQPGVTGVMCCKLPAERPRIVVPPSARMEVYTGRIFLLTCQATGVPTPRVQWYKDGSKLLPGNARVSVLQSGDLLVSLSRKSDSGLYSCEVMNEEGIDMASSHVIVKDRSSGCRDGASKGLQMHEGIDACQGQWKGHVKHGRTLCNKGWHVCNSRDENVLKELSWLDIFDMKGCFAYNAENHHRKCRRCHQGPMAGIGRNCGRVKYLKSSCLAQGRIDVFSKSNGGVLKDGSCSYAEGITTGVLCCKNRDRHRDGGRNTLQRESRCALGCQNSGICIGHNRCLCPVGYKGTMCQNAICNPSCGHRAMCVSPGKCQCKSKYTGKDCKYKIKDVSCGKTCLNGGQCRKNTCKCPPTYYGSSCQYSVKETQLTSENRTER